VLPGVAEPYPGRFAATSRTPCRAAAAGLAASRPSGGRSVASYAERETVSGRRRRSARLSSGSPV